MRDPAARDQMIKTAVAAHAEIERDKERLFHAAMRGDRAGHPDVADFDPLSVELFRGMMKASAMLTSLADKRLAGHGLTSAKMRILFLLMYRAGDGGMLPSELSKLQGVTPNTVTSLLKSLRASGSIEQVDHPHDKRKRLVRITETGRALIQDVAPNHGQLVQMLFGDMPADLRAHMAEGLRQLIDKLIVLHAEFDADDPHCRLPDHGSDNIASHAPD